MCGEYGETLFQFHKGTIKACQFCKRGSRKMLFQFHKGTIKAQKVYNDFYRFSQISIP